MPEDPRPKHYPVMSRRMAWLIGFFAFTTLWLLRFGYFYFDDLASGMHMPHMLGRRLLQEGTGVYTVALIFPFLVRIARRLRFTHENWRRMVAAHIGVMVAFSVYSTTAMAVTRAILFPVFGLGHYDYGIMAYRYPMEFFNHVLSYWSLVGCVYLIDSYREARDRQVANAELEAQLAQAQLQNLRLQLNPHFLFNTLNTISSVMYEDVNRADAMLAQLSELLRHTLRQNDSQQVSLAEELTLLKLYLGIMQVRFGDDLKVRFEIDKAAERALVPQMILQPLLENSIRYGADGASRREIDLRAVRENGNVILQVRDHGPGMPDGGPRLRTQAKPSDANMGSRSGLGLSNTAERLEALYGADHEFSIENAAGGGLSVRMRLPYRPAEAQ